MRTLVAFLTALVVLAGAAATATAPVGAAEKITLLQGFHSMSFTPLYVAKAKKLFEAEGLDVDLQIVSGSSLAFKGAVAGQAQFAAMGATELITAAEKGLDRMVAVAAVNRAVTVSLAMRKDVAEAKGLKAGSPIKERVAALKGLRIATGSPGGAIHTVVTYMLKQGGIDPKNDTTLLSMGGTAPMLAALRVKQIDAIAISPPAPETAAAEGLGVLLISLSRGDMPEMGTIAYDALVTSKEYAQKNPEIVRKVVRAIGQASNFVMEQPAETREIMLRAFDKTPPDVMAAVIDNLKGAFARDARFTEEMWKNAIHFNVEAGKIAKRLETREGVLWTNEYNTGR